LLLDDLRLPHLPERFRNMPLVMQVEEKEQKNDETLPGWENFVKATFDEIAAQETIDRDTVEWRSQFMKNNPSWTAKDVADQSTSTAKNRAALASRWAQEGKIFAVKYEGQLWDPHTRTWARFLHDSFRALQGLSWHPRLGGPGLAYMLFGDRCAPGALTVTSGPTDVDSGSGFVKVFAIAQSAN